MEPTENKESPPQAQGNLEDLLPWGQAPEAKRQCILSLIVEKTAEDWLPREISELVRETISVRIGVTMIRYLLSRKLKDQVIAKRAHVDVNGIPIAHVSVRLTRYERLYHQVKNKNPKQAAEILQMAAKESTGLVERRPDAETGAMKELAEAIRGIKTEDAYLNLLERASAAAQRPGAAQAH